MKHLLEFVKGHNIHTIANGDPEDILQDILKWKNKQDIVDTLHGKCHHLGDTLKTVHIKDNQIPQELHSLILYAPYTDIMDDSCERLFIMRSSGTKWSHKNDPDKNKSKDIGITVTINKSGEIIHTEKFDFDMVEWWDIVLNTTRQASQKKAGIPPIYDMEIYSIGYVDDTELDNIMSTLLEEFCR